MELVVENLTKTFGGIRALDGVSLTAERGRITALIGPNGAGKTTLFSVISGFLRPDSGRVEYGGAELTGQPPHRVAACGVGRLFQDVRVFAKLTALDNVAVARKGQPGENPARLFLAPRQVRAAEQENLHAARAYLDFAGIAGKAEMWAEHLSYGEQKLLAIARLLANGSDLLLLDEPTSGVHHDMVDSVLHLLTRLAEDGRTVVVIEHNLNVVLRISDWTYLMHGGRIAAFGTPREVLSDSALQEAFLGV